MSNVKEVEDAFRKEDTLSITDNHACSAVPFVRECGAARKRIIKETERPSRNILNGAALVDMSCGIHIRSRCHRYFVSLPAGKGARCALHNTQTQGRLETYVRQLEQE